MSCLLFLCDPSDSHDSDDISGAFGAQYAQNTRNVPGNEEPQREMSSTWQDRIDDDWPATSEGLAMPSHLPNAKSIAKASLILDIVCIAPLHSTFA